MDLDLGVDLPDSQPGDTPYRLGGYSFWMVNGHLRPVIAGGDEPDDDPEDSDDPEDPDDPDDELTPEQLAAEVKKWKALSRKHEDQAKKNRGHKRELDELKRKHATDDERTKLQAKDEGKAEALKELAPRLLAAEVKAAAGDRMTSEARAALLDGLDATKFLTDDGDVDTDKVTALIEGIAGKSDKDEPKKKLDLGQGRGRGKADGAKPSVSSGRDLFAERNAKGTDKK